MTKKNSSENPEQLAIQKNDPVKVIQGVIDKAARKKKKNINIHQYFGKVDFGSNGLTYQKKVRDEWK